MAAPKREELIGFRCRPPEAGVIRTAAELEGVTVSEFVRDRLIPEARRVVAGADAGQEDGNRDD